MNLKTLFAAAFAATLLATATAEKRSPAGWILTGQSPNKYEILADSEITVSGKPSVLLTAQKEAGQTWAASAQALSPERYLGKRIRMSGYLMTKDATRATMWLRIDGAKGPRHMDNMQDRPVTGSTAWRRYELVLDVPSDATNIAFGSILGGNGSVWMDKVVIEAVDNTVPLTNDVFANAPPKEYPIGVEIR
jgi:AraC family transcriptional regulator